MKAIQISIGRFHHFHLARQFEKHHLLDLIYTGYPSFKLKDEKGIPPEKIKTFPWVQVPFMMRGKFGLDKWKRLDKNWAWLAHQTLDKYVARQIRKPAVLVSLSGTGLYSGKAAKREGGVHICDRGSSHIKHQDNLLREEYNRWGLSFEGVDPRKIDKEMKEYAQADFITVPSEFVRRSFIDMGVDASRLVKIPYGARLDRFSKTGEPDAETFRVLWVGGVTIRKGFMYLLHAFQKFRHPKKELLVIGNVSDDIKNLIEKENLTNVTFRGILANNQLAGIYSTSHVFVLPSLEEGLALVQGEALACGCPVIASTNTGAEDLFTDGQEGFVIPIRSEEAIVEKLEQLAQDKFLRSRMSEAAVSNVQNIGGWDKYGDSFVQLIKTVDAQHAV